LFLLVQGMLVGLSVTTAVLAATGLVNRTRAALATIGSAVGMLAPEPFACAGTSVMAVGL